MKYVLALIVLVLALSQLWRKLRTALQKMAGTAGADRRRGAAQIMMPCDLCGVHVPQNEAFYRAGRAYCSAAHARQTGTGGPGAQAAAPNKMPNKTRNKVPTD